MAIDVGINFSALAAKMNGKVLRPENEGYKEAIHHWATLNDRNPAAIAQVATAADVADAVFIVSLINLILDSICQSQ
jgi:hypothetical protein